MIAKIDVIKSIGHSRANSCRLTPESFRYPILSPLITDPTTLSGRSHAFSVAKPDHLLGKLKGFLTCYGNKIKWVVFAEADEDGKKREL